MSADGDGDQEQYATDSEVEQMSDAEVDIGSDTERRRDDDFDDPVVVLDANDMALKQNQMASEVASLLCISPDVAASLLLYFKWNKSKLQARYWEETESIQKKAGIRLESTPPVYGGLCEVCYATETTPDTAYALECGHVFCKECWRDHCRIKIAGGVGCLRANCMRKSCTVSIHPGHMMRLVAPEDAQRYRKFYVESFVAQNPNIKWCRNPESCTYAAAYQGTSRPVVKCRCGFSWCWQCGVEAHAPANCENVAAWVSKSNDEAENTKWILANTKPCSFCKIPVNKNGGCNHMTCPQCRGEFCWLCRGPWSEHGTATGGFYKCNKYEKSKAKEDDVNSESLKSAHDRYLHYFERYYNHDKAEGFAKRQKEHTQTRMLEYSQETGWSAEFLMEAAELVIVCRHVLKWTYVFGFYLEASAEKQLFEYLQEMLEKNTEHLSGLTETPATKIDPSELKNYTRVTRTFLQNLVEGCQRGLTNQTSEAAATSG